MYLKAKPYSTVCNNCMTMLLSGQLYHQELRTDPGYHIIITCWDCMTEEQQAAALVAQKKETKSEIKTKQTAADQMTMWPD